MASALKTGREGTSWEFSRCADGVVVFLALAFTPPSSNSDAVKESVSRLFFWALAAYEIGVCEQRIAARSFAFGNNATFLP